MDYLNQSHNCQALPSNDGLDPGFAEPGPGTTEESGAWMPPPELVDKQRRIAIARSFTCRDQNGGRRFHYSREYLVGMDFRLSGFGFSRSWSFFNSAAIGVWRTISSAWWANSRMVSSVHELTGHGGRNRLKSVLRTGRPQTTMICPLTGVFSKCSLFSRKLCRTRFLLLAGLRPCP
jgi:hypothetical protein